MTPAYTDPWLTTYGGDVREVLPTLPPESVNCVVTSPPYWGLRDYGTASLAGGDPDCDHMRPIVGKNATSTLNAARNPDGTLTGKAQPSGTQQYAGACRKCGAVRQDRQLGLEPTPEEYVANMVAVFREVRRVLRADGTVWLNLGDSYAGGGRGGNPDESSFRKQAPNHGSVTGATKEPWPVPSGLKPKDLVGIPWRVAFALQADGWYLRSDIIWAKPNPMPESVTDRPTKAHEYVFLLTKSARYWYDADAVREQLAPDTHPSGNGFDRGGVRLTHGEGSTEEWVPPTKRGRVPAGWDTAAGGHVTTRNNGRQPGPIEYRDLPSGRNLRSVWTVATAPYPGAHFATFPPKLVEPCIKAGCPEGGTVLDPFAGTGTALMVAQRLSRRAVGIDLNPEYLRQCLERNRDIPLGLTEAAS